MFILYCYQRTLIFDVGHPVESILNGIKAFELLDNSLQDIIHVVESKPAKRYGDYFLRQIVKVYSFLLGDVKLLLYLIVIFLCCLTALFGGVCSLKA